MKRLFVILLIGFLPQLAKTQDIPPKPDPARFVNDYVNILSADQSGDLEHKLNFFSDSTSNQVVVVIISSTKGYDISDYATSLGRKWGVGTKEFNNGTILLIAKDDRKVFIATGYGLEGALPDATCKEIVDNDIVPYFKDQDFYRGISNGINDIIAATKGEYKPPYKSSGRSSYWWVTIYIFLIGLLGLGRRRGGKGVYFSRRNFGGGSSSSNFGGGSFSGGGSSSSFGGGSFGGGGAGGSW